MIAELYDLFLKNIEMELDGYCEYNINFDYDDYSFEHIPYKLYLFYINTQEGKFEFVFSKELDIFDVNEEFPEKDRNSRLKARKAEIRAKRRQKNIDFKK